MTNDFITQLVQMLKEDRAIGYCIIKPFSDDRGRGVEIVASTGERLRLRYVPISLGQAEMASGIIYPGGIQLAVILPEDQETYHTINIPLPYIPLIIKILEIWVKDLINDFEEVTADLTNAQMISSAIANIYALSEMKSKQAEFDKEVDRDVV